MVCAVVLFVCIMTRLPVARGQTPGNRTPPAGPSGPSALRADRVFVGLDSDASTIRFATDGVEEGESSTESSLQLTGGETDASRSDREEKTRAEATDPKEKPEDWTDTSDDAPAGSPASKADDILNELLKDWKNPKFVFFVTGRLHGYMEPCGCTGLDKAKGGISRRHTMLTEIRKRGWNIIPLDVGNQVRRFGRQADMKFQRVAGLMDKMNYAAVGFGPDDLRMSLDGLLFPVSDAGNFVMGNVDLAQLNRPERIIQSSGTRIGLAAVLGLAEQNKLNRSEEDVIVTNPRIGIEKSRVKFEAAHTEFNVLLAHASLEETNQMVTMHPDLFDLVVTAGGAGEPTLEPARVAGSKARIIQVGTKGMYVGLVGVFDNPQRPIRYARVPLDASFEDSELVLEVFADYQSDLQVVGLEGLGVRPIKHPSGHRFVGHEKCAECHTDAAAVFRKTDHFHATNSLIHPPNSRSAIPRNFDPECLSCHVTGWEPQKYLPFESGYLDVSMETLHSNGCENCHGPGSAHVAAESGDVDLTDAEIVALRQQMRLTLAAAKKSKCYECHDTDNSPDFDFDSYWEKIKHYGKE